MLDLLGRDAAAGVDDVDDRVPCRPTASERISSPPPSGIACSALIIRLSTACLISCASTRRRRGVGVLLQAELHALDLRLRGEEVDQLFEQLVQLGRLAVELDPAGVAQEVVEDVAQARRLACTVSSRLTSRR